MQVGHFLFFPQPQGPDNNYHGIITLPKTKRGRNESVYDRSYLIAELSRQQQQMRYACGASDTEKFFEFISATLRKCMNAIFRSFNIILPDMKMHGLRYGGATTDDMEGRLPRAEIQQRVRWADAKSMLEYLQPDHVHNQRSNLDTNLRGRLERLLAQRYHFFNVAPDTRHK